MGGQSSFKTRPQMAAIAAADSCSARGEHARSGPLFWSPTLANPAVSHPANPTDPKQRRVVGNGAGIVQRLGRRLTKPQMQVRLPLPASPFPFLNTRRLTPFF